MGDNDVFAIVPPGEGDVELAVDAMMSVFRQELLQPIPEQVMHVKRGVERTEGFFACLDRHAQYITGHIT